MTYDEDGGSHEASLPPHDNIADGSHAYLHMTTSLHNQVSKNIVVSPCISRGHVIVPEHFASTPVEPPNGATSRSKPVARFVESASSRVEEFLKGFVPETTAHSILPGQLTAWPDGMEKWKGRWCGACSRGYSNCRYKCRELPNCFHTF